MIGLRIGIALGLTVSIAGAAINNDWPKAAEDCDRIVHPITSDPLWKRSIACLTDFFTARPVHLTVKSIVPGGGFGLGPTFQADFNADKWQNKFVATGVGSLRQFWSTEGMFRSTHDKFGINNSARDRFAVDIYARARDLPRMVFYGEGPHTGTTSLVNFRERDVVAGADVFNPFSAWLAGGARIESIWPDVGGVTDPGLRSITST